MTVTSRLDAIEARANAATEGPWELFLPWIGSSGIVGVKGRDLVSPNVLERDATFIAAARTDVPALVAAIRGVMEVHAPAWGPVIAVGHYCRGCGASLTDESPDCPTVATITAALTEVSA